MNLINRYRDLRTKLNDKKKTVYKTILYPTIEKQFSDIYLVPSTGDRLDLLAYKHYGDVRYWWIIAQANHLGKGSMVIPAGVRIRVPKDLTKILNDFTEINKNR